MGDNISTDTISPAGAEALPFRANMQGIAEFSFKREDATYVERAKATKETGGHALIAGNNYGQGSSREHAALAPQWLGLRLALVKSFARIHEQNLINSGILPLRFDNESDYNQLTNGDILAVTGVHAAVRSGNRITVNVKNKGLEIPANFNMSPRQVEIFLAGGLINWFRDKLGGPAAGAGKTSAA